MKYRVSLRTDDPGLVEAVLRRTQVPVVIDHVKMESQKRVGAQDPTVAKRIVELSYDESLSLNRIAAQTGVSYHTVLRVLRNPGRYGVDHDPIWRRGPALYELI